MPITISKQQKKNFLQHTLNVCLIYWRAKVRRRESVKEIGNVVGVHSASAHDDLWRVCVFLGGPIMCECMYCRMQRIAMDNCRQSVSSQRTILPMMAKHVHRIFIGNSWRTIASQQRCLLFFCSFVLLICFAYDLCEDRAAADVTVTCKYIRTYYRHNRWAQVTLWAHIQRQTHAKGTLGLWCASCDCFLRLAWSRSRCVNWIRQSRRQEKKNNNKI